MCGAVTDKWMTLGEGDWDLEADTAGDDDG